MNAFDAYYPKERRHDLARQAPRMVSEETTVDLTEAEKSDIRTQLVRLKKLASDARSAGGSSAHVDGRIKLLTQQIKTGKKRKGAKIKEDGPPMPPPGPGGPPGGADPLAALGPAPGGAGGANAAAKTFIKIAVDAVNFLSQKESDLSGLPPDSPELATVRNAEGLLREYTPEPGDDNKTVSSKVSLLARELQNLFNDGGNGEVVEYLRQFSAKVDEFRATIDVGDAGPEMGAPEPKDAPAKPKKDAPPATPQEREADLAKGLEVAQ